MRIRAAGLFSAATLALAYLVVLPVSVLAEADGDAAIAAEGGREPVGLLVVFAVLALGGLVMAVSEAGRR